MKKLILTLMICFAFGIMANAQTVLIWEINKDTLISTNNDTVIETLYYFIPMPDAKNVKSKFILTRIKNDTIFLDKDKFNNTQNLDSNMTYGAITKTQFEWLQTFITIDVSKMKIYGEEIFKQKIDPQGKIVNFD